MHAFGRGVRGGVVVEKYAFVTGVGARVDGETIGGNVVNGGET